MRIADKISFREKLMCCTAAFVCTGIGLVCAVSLFAQTSRLSQGCGDGPRNQAKFKVVFEGETVEKHLLIDVVIKPSSFTRENLVATAAKLRAQYCNAKYVGVTFYESKQDTHYGLYEQVLSDGKNDPRRGTYLIDRENGIDRIEYNTKKGNPLDECAIDLSLRPPSK